MSVLTQYARQPLVLPKKGIIMDTNLVLWAPLWHPHLKASPFTTKDKIGHSCTVTGATWGSQGYSSNELNQISVSGAILQNLPNNNFTLINICKITTLNRTTLIQSVGDWVLTVESDGSVRFVVGLATTNAIYQSAASLITANQSASISVVWDSTSKSADIYVDGVVSPSYQTSQSGVGAYSDDSAYSLLSTITTIYGVQWNQGTETWSRIDPLGNIITLSDDFDNIYPWSDIVRVTLANDGTVNTVGVDGKGSNLTLDGSDGRVMVRIPKFFVKGANPSANVYNYWIAPVSLSGFVVHPAFVQRGGVEKDYIYVGAYDADFEYDGADAAYNAANEKLHSRTAKQPYTGNADCIWSIPVDDLAFEPNIGDVCSTPTEGGFIIVDYLKTAGAWGGGGAGDTAIIWLRKPGDATCGMAGAEVLTNDTQANIIGNTTAGPTGRTVIESHCRTLAENIGAGWGIFSIWPLSAVQLLFYTEYAGADSQTLVGSGVTGKAGGTGFNGELSGANSTDTEIGENGTGQGTGTEDETPIAYRGIENLWGNIWQFIDGYDGVDGDVGATDVKYRLINRDGSGTFANPMAGGDYEESLNETNPADGYIKNIVYQELTKLVFFSSDGGGSSSTYLYDYFYVHDAGEVNILRAGGNWADGVLAGVGCRYSDRVAADASRSIGVRLEFIGSNGDSLSTLDKGILQEGFVYNRALSPAEIAQSSIMVER